MPDPTLNAAQAQAIDSFDQSAAVTAGAGSGKTTVLVERYLRLIEHGTPVDRLVAITFTRKAAAEMSTRLRERLEDRLRHITDPANRDRLMRALRDMNAARIGTIHSLCGDIVRANAAACGVDPGFEVMDEVQSAVLFTQVVNRVLREQTNTPPASPLMQIIRDYGLKTVREALAPELLAQAAHTFDHPLDLAAIEQAERAHHLAKLRVLAAYIGQHIVGLPVPEGDKQTETVETLQRDYPALAADTPDWDTIEPVLKVIESIKPNNGLKKNWDKVGVDSDKLKAHLSKIKELGTGLSYWLSPGNIERHAIYTVGWHALAREVWNAYTEAKYRRNVLDFNDLEHLAAHALRDDAVAARYQAQFAQVMVDEFQDTSAAQWDIIRRVAPPTERGRLFIVGDPKQSIYGFRGSDHTVFAAAKTTLAHSIALDTSYRTHAPLLDVLNALFAEVMKPPANARNLEAYVEFEPLTAHRTTPNQPTAPYFRVHTFNPKQDLVEGVTKWSADDIRVQEARHIAEHIAALQAEGVRWGDIALLFRAGTHFDTYEDALRAHDIPFQTNAGRGYFNRREVEDLTHALSALFAPHDDLALATTLHSPLFGLSDAALYVLRRDPLVSLWDALTAAPPADFPTDELPQLDLARAVLNTLRPKARRTRVADLLRELLERTGTLPMVEAQYAGAQARANLHKMVSLAERSGMITLSAFLNYLTQAKDAEARESDAALDAENAVQIMTIHASKGLEFRVVFLPDASSKGGGSGAARLLLSPERTLACRPPSKGEKDKDKPPQAPITQRAIDAQNDRESAEALRVFYVAATRAKDLLIVTGSASESDNTKLGKILAQRNTLQSDFNDSVAFADIVAKPVVRQRAQTAPKAIPPAVEGIAPVAPDLLQTVPSQPFDRARHITTTDLAHLSQSQHADTDDARNAARARFRRGVVGQSDSPIRFLTGGEGSGHAPARIVGEVVHEAIRFGYDALTGDALRSLLQGLVWSQSVAPNLHDDAVTRAADLLEQYRASPLYQDIQNAGEHVYREIPFVYALGAHKRIIHGQIDLLYRTAGSAWVLVDYKTDYVPQRDFTAHSQRHLTQLAVYTRAVRERLAHLPDLALTTKLHYIAYNHTHLLPADQLEAALSTDLDPLIHAALSEDARDG